MSNFKEFMSSKNGQRILYGIGAVILAMLIFHAGVAIGSHRNFRGNGERNWGFRAPGFDVRFPRGFIQNGHGAVGIIQNVATSSITVQTRDGGTQTILITEKATIRSQSRNASSTVLTAGQQVVILGTPNDDGSMSANLIRVIPDGISPLRSPIKR